MVANGVGFIQHNPVPSQGHDALTALALGAGSFSSGQECLFSPTGRKVTRQRLIRRNDLHMMAKGYQI